MSSDNGYHIVKDGTQYVPVHYFLSSEEPIIPKKGMPRFDTFGEAFQYAIDNYTEYGVSFSFDVGEEITNERNR